MKRCIGIVLAWILALTPGAAVLSEEEICDGIYRGFLLRRRYRTDRDSIRAQGRSL